MDDRQCDADRPAPRVCLLFAARVNHTDQVLDLVAVDDITLTGALVPAGAPFTMWIRTGLERHPLDALLEEWADASELLEFRWEPPSISGRGWLLLESMDAMIALKTIDLVS
jgi:hypothetical protein